MADKLFQNEHFSIWEIKTLVSEVSRNLYCVHQLEFYILEISREVISYANFNRKDI